MKKTNQLIENVKKLQDKVENIYIYGAGLHGQNIYKMLVANGICISGFVVTADEQKTLHDLPVIKIRELREYNVGFVIGANRRNTMEIYELLKQLNYNLENIVIASEYLENRKYQTDYYDVPTIEITTTIGCRINCRFCPQTLLVSKYFEGNSNREVTMSMETFMKCMESLPDKCNIMFCGMSEPFLNPYCSEMIYKAYEMGKNVELYTTLVGIKKEELSKIWDIPMELVNIHLPDERGYANIPTTEEYYENLRLAIEHVRADGKKFVNMCNAQGKPERRAEKICGEYEIFTTLHDRAGNLQDEKLIHKKDISGKIRCTLCGQDLNHNVLLPDGTLLLCCMDYGMKHILGNLKERKYDEIMNCDKMKYIKLGLEREEIDILCRTCSFASKYN